MLDPQSIDAYLCASTFKINEIIKYVPSVQLSKLIEDIRNNRVSRTDKRVVAKAVSDYIITERCEFGVMAPSRGDLISLCENDEDNGFAWTYIWSGEFAECFEGEIPHGYNVITEFPPYFWRTVRCHSNVVPFDYSLVGESCDLLIYKSLRWVVVDSSTFVVEIAMKSAVITFVYARSSSCGAIVRNDPTHARQLKEEVCAKLWRNEYRATDTFDGLDILEALSARDVANRLWISM
jgi:hypothetical protein